MNPPSLPTPTDATLTVLEWAGVTITITAPDGQPDPDAVNLVWSALTSYSLDRQPVASDQGGDYNANDIVCEMNEILLRLADATIEATADTTAMVVLPPLGGPVMHPDLGTLWPARDARHDRALLTAAVAHAFTNGLQLSHWNADLYRRLLQQHNERVKHITATGLEPPAW